MTHQENKMAVPVDSFGLLWQEIIKIYDEYTSLGVRSLTFRDYLTLFGGICAAGVCYCATRRLYEAFKVHGLSRLVRRPDLPRLYGPWAVVTGSTHGIGRALVQELASDGFHLVIISLGQRDCEQVSQKLVVTGCTGGIGEEFAYQLAASGLHVVLVSRSESAMKDLSDRLEEKFKIKTCIVPVDFNEGPSVYPKIKTALADKDIGLLVNNVGVMYDYPQMFMDVPEDKIWQLVNVNVAAATMMTSIVLPGMVERKRGAIVTMSSGSCLQPTPQMTVYCATKAYLDVFMRALGHEYKDSGITFQSLMPFYVATRMTEFSSTLSNPSILIPSATNYARSALCTLGWSNRTTGYWPHGVQAFITSLIPENMWMWGAMRLNDAFRRQAFTRLDRRAAEKTSPDPSKNTASSPDPSKNTPK